MAKHNKKKIIFTGVSLIVLIAIIVFTYLFLVGKPFYKINDIEKDEVIKIALSKSYDVIIKEGDLPKPMRETEKYERVGLNSDKFDGINNMLSKLRFAKSLSKEWRLKGVAIPEAAQDVTLYSVTVTTKNGVQNKFFFFEDDVNKINTDIVSIETLYRKGIFSKLDLEKYFPEDNK